MSRIGGALILALVLSGCGYFNSLYNAKRQFAEGERASARGAVQPAQDAYKGAIEKAARSYRKHPKGRWSDDALHVIARARFELGEYPAARAAAHELLALSSDPAMRADAHAIAGASALALDDVQTALVHLDTAVVGASDALRGRAHLWRARAYRKTNELERAWQDLDAVDADDPYYLTVQLERINFGVQQRDTARTTAAFASVLARAATRQNLDTVFDLALQAVQVFGASATRTMLSAPLPDWLTSARDSVALIRAEVALRGGDTLSAVDELAQLSARSIAVVANAARLRLARTKLPRASELEDLQELRNILLPAITDPSVPPVLRNMRIVEMLVQKSQTSGQPVALYAAAEVARDELGAYPLARRLFTTYADVAPQTPWAAKALLAAIALAPDAPESAVLRTRLGALSTSPYAQALNGGTDPQAFAVAEERLQRSLIAMRDEGGQLADRQDVAVNRAVATLDSLRLAAHTDSVRHSCGMLIDTLAIVGVRADSVRGACMRADTIKLADFLKADTMVLRGQTRDRADSLANRRRLPDPKARRDTIN
jgi:tetratricopeptide (TPR) repeat protein